MRTFMPRLKSEGRVSIAATDASPPIDEPAVPTRWPPTTYKGTFLSSLPGPKQQHNIEREGGGSVNESCT